MPIIAPSILAADFRNLEREFTRIHTSDAEWIHFDMMDGIFVPNISFGFPILKTVRNLTTRHIDVHLMLTEPHKYIKACIENGADSISFHIEANSPVQETLHMIKNTGKKA
jgi:ribulose-phosphate 3-epimerase